MKTHYKKDNGIYVKNFSGQFGPVDETVLQLLNNPGYIYKEGGREYIKKAYRFDKEGNVYFKKIYITVGESGLINYL